MMNSRPFYQVWWGVGVVVAFLAATTISAAWGDWPRNWNFAFGQFEQSPVKNPGAHAAVTLLFGCPTATINKCWDVARNAMVDNPASQRAEIRQ